MAEITVKWADFEKAASQLEERKEKHYQMVLNDTIEAANKELKRWLSDIVEGRASLNPHDCYSIDFPQTADSVRLLEDLNKVLIANGFFAWHKNKFIYLQEYKKE